MATRKIKISKRRIWIRKVREAFFKWIRGLFKRQKSKIIIRPPKPKPKPQENQDITETEQLTIRSKIKNCRACGLAIEPGEPTAKCQDNPAHIVHKDCAVKLVRGKCPTCGHPLKVD